MPAVGRYRVGSLASGGVVEHFEARRTSFGARAAAYDRVRPGYPDAAIRWVIGTGSSVVIDLGTGTGRLGGRCRALGATSMGIEPDPGMTAIAVTALPEGTVRAKAEHVPVEDGRVDAVVAGQAWHWFDHAATVVECGRILRPGGRLGVFRNVRDESEPWVAAFGDIIGGEDRTGSDSFMAHALRFGDPFEGEAQKDFPHRHRLAAADLVQLAATHSYVSTRPDAQDVLAQVHELVCHHPSLAGRDEVDVPYVCRVTRAVRR